MLAMSEVMETALNFEKKIYRNFYFKKMERDVATFSQSSLCKATAL